MFKKHVNDKKTTAEQIDLIAKSPMVVIPFVKDYEKIKRQMRSLIRMAKEVIEEVEKDAPNDVLICDIAVEEIEELLEQINSTVLGNCRPNN